LDYLFKKNQLEKVAERTEERGWYLVDLVWTGEEKSSLDDANRLSGIFSSQDKDSLSNGGGTDSSDGNSDPESFTCPADETQDQCAICDIYFKMFFDNEDGMYRYRNCIELSVIMDDTAMNEMEKMLVHVTCWRALGCPDSLNMDQVLVRHLNR
jgi:pre-mRNA cleavage complex 2 protein Pcf11